MRVLVVSQYFWPETFRINDVVLDLTQRGHDVTVLTGLPNYPDGVVFPEYRADPKRFAQFAGAGIVRVPVFPRGRGSWRLMLNYATFVLTGCLLGPWLLREREFDIIFIFQLSPVTSAIPGLVVSRFRKLPVMMWVLDLWPDTLAALGVVRTPWVLDLIGRMVGAIYRRCNLVLGQSRAFESNVRRLSGDSSRFRYLPGWPEPIFQGELTGIKPAAAVAQYMDGTFNVFFAGNLGESQGLPALLDAVEELRNRHDIRFILVGDGRAAGWVRAEVKRRNLEDRVILLGRYPIEEMPSFFRAASALLVTLKPDPAFANTIPGKVQAYMATGLPLLGMLDGEGARILRESGSGFVAAAGDGVGLANRVREMATLTLSERAAMGARGKEYANREFNREMLLTRITDWMNELTGGSAQ